MNETPLYITDNDTRDYLVYDQQKREYIFDTIYRCSAIPHIEEEIQKHKCPIRIAFHVQITATEAVTEICYSSEQVGEIWGHGELWFGKNIARMVTGDKGSYLISLPPKRYETLGWEVFTLPFHDSLKAFRIANKIVQTTTLKHIGYGIYLLRVVING